VARIEEMRTADNILTGETYNKKPLGRTRLRPEDLN
jgi:hypothetical protein